MSGNGPGDKPEDKVKTTHSFDVEDESGALASGEMTPAEQRIRQMAKVVCICKGINLGRVMKGLEGSETVADVNRKVGTGTGGCQGERCGPRIKLLLKKYKETKQR